MPALMDVIRFRCLGRLTPTTSIREGKPASLSYCDSTMELLCPIDRWGVHGACRCGLKKPLGGNALPQLASPLPLPLPNHLLSPPLAQHEGRGEHSGRLLHVYSRKNRHLGSIHPSMECCRVGLQVVCRLYSVVAASTLLRRHSLDPDARASAA